MGEEKATFNGVLKKAIAVNSKPTEKSFPELPKVLIWIRAIIGAAYGLYLGYYGGKRSAVVILQAFNLICFVPMVYCRYFLGASPEVFPSQTFFGGLHNALALCLLLWVYGFTVQHSGEEARMMSLLIAKTVAKDDQTAKDPLAGAAGYRNEELVSTGQEQPIPEESEF